MKICSNCYWWKKHTRFEGECLKLKNFKGTFLITVWKDFCSRHKKMPNLESVGKEEELLSDTYYY